MFLTLTSRDADTYYICIRNVSPVLLSQCFWRQGAFCRVSFFCWVRCVFAESVFAESDFLLTRHVIAESVLLSQLFADQARIVVVDRQFIDVNIDRDACTVAEGPHDAESWFRSETYNIRILNVLPIFAESVFLMTRRVFAESVFFLSQFLLSHQFLLSLTV